MKERKKINFFSRIIGIILNFFLVIVTILIVIGMYYIYQIKIKNSEYANIFGYTFFEVATGSMSPTIEVGDIVIVKITKEIEKNDIIIYKENNSYIAHRLIEKKDNLLVAKGDANNSKDKPIKYEDIMGKVILTVPKVGLFRKIILSPEIIGLIVLVLLLFGATFIYTKPEKKDEE